MYQFIIDLSAKQFVNIWLSSEPSLPPPQSNPIHLTISAKSENTTETKLNFSTFLRSLKGIESRIFQEVFCIYKQFRFVQTLECQLTQNFIELKNCIYLQVLSQNKSSYITTTIRSIKNTLLSSTKSFQTCVCPAKGSSIGHTGLKT